MGNASNNEESFFFTAANFRENLNGSAKSLSLCYVFSYEKGTRFYNAPGISVKIKTNSSYDNTECKTFVSPDSIGLFIAVMKEAYSKGGSRQYIGRHSNMFFTLVEQDKFCIKITGEDGYSNDINIDRNSFAFMIKSCDSLVSNMIPVTLQFMQTVQAQETMNVLSEIRSMIATVKSVICKSDSTPEPVPVIKADVISEPEPIVQAHPVSAPAPITVFEETTETPSDVMTEPEATAFDTDMGDIEVAASGNAEIVKPNITDVPDMKSANDALDRAIRESVSKDPVSEMADLISSVISEAYDKKIQVKDIFDTAISKAELPSVRNAMDLCFYTDMNYAIFERYMAKLAYVTEHRDAFTSKVPVFTYPIVDDARYTKVISTFAKALLHLYTDSRSRVDKCRTEGKPLDDKVMFVYSCLRYIFAPVWSSYVRATHEELPEFFMKLRMPVHMTLQKCNGNVESILDQYLALNKAVYESSDDKTKNPVYKLFTTVCPSMCMALKKNASSDALNALASYMDTLSMDTSLEETVIPENFNPSLYTNECLCVLRTLSKTNNVTAKTTYEELTNIYNRIYDLDANNSCEVIAALKCIDHNSNDMEESVPF